MYGGQWKGPTEGWMASLTRELRWTRVGTDMRDSLLHYGVVDTTSFIGTELNWTDFRFFKILNLTNYCFRRFLIVIFQIICLLLSFWDSYAYTQRLVVVTQCISASYGLSTPDLLDKVCSAVRVTSAIISVSAFPRSNFPMKCGCFWLWRQTPDFSVSPFAKVARLISTFLSKGLKKSFWKNR